MRILGYLCSLFFGAVFVPGFLASAFSLAGSGIVLDIPLPQRPHWVAPSLPEPVEPPVDPVSDSWSVEESQSPMDDSPVVILSLSDAHGRPVFSATESGRTLHIRCKDYRTDVYVSTSWGFSPEGASETTPALDESVRIRLDDTPARQEVWAQGGGGSVLLPPDPVGLARQLAAAERFLIELTHAGGRSEILTFELHGLRKHIGKVAAACNWTV